MEEDRLLTRIESLENQLIISNKVSTFLSDLLRQCAYQFIVLYVEFPRRQITGRNKKTVRRKEYLSGCFERVATKSHHGENGNVKEASGDRTVFAKDFKKQLALLTMFML